MTKAAAAVAVAAVDLGASSGRVMVGRVGQGVLQLVEVNRFPNQPVVVRGSMYWDILALYRGVLDGLRAAGRQAAPLASIGIDSWAVDYGLLDESGGLLENPRHYRDRRTEGVMARVLLDVPAARLYEVTGLQLLPFNTIFQLVAARGTPTLEAARTLLMIPDLLSYWLTGEIGAEVTNASTTQLFDVRNRRVGPGPHADPRSTHHPFPRIAPTRGRGRNPDARGAGPDRPTSTRWR